MGRHMLAHDTELRFGQAQGHCDQMNDTIGLTPAQADDYILLLNLTYELLDF